jgi:hypothetical protein
LDDGGARHRALRTNRVERRACGDLLHGLRLWVALPAAKEKWTAFAHHGVNDFPMVRIRASQCA